VLQDAGIEGVLSGVQMPRMNSIMERWVQTCRHELLDRTLMWNQRHLLHALREFEHFYNEHRPTGPSGLPHRCAPYPNRLPIPSGSRTSMFADVTGSAASSTSTGMPPDQHG
jgi:putative transposase